MKDFIFLRVSHFARCPESGNSGFLQPAFILLSRHLLQSKLALLLRNTWGNLVYLPNVSCHIVWRLAMLSLETGECMCIGMWVCVHACMVWDAKLCSSSHRTSPLTVDDISIDWIALWVTLLSNGFWRPWIVHFSDPTSRHICCWFSPGGALCWK